MGLSTACQASRWPHSGRVAKVGELGEDVVVESVVHVVDGVSEHWYRLVGGPDDGHEFATLIEVYDYARKLARPA